jgi:hypothetical protein
MPLLRQRGSVESLSGKAPGGLPIDASDEERRDLLLDLAQAMAQGPRHPRGWGVFCSVLLSFVEAHARGKTRMLDASFALQNLK